MNEYSYSGPVTEYGRCICNSWHGSTRAVSEKKARSNLAYQFKVRNNRLAAAQIGLPGKIILVEEGIYGRDQT